MGSDTKWLRERIKDEPVGAGLVAVAAISVFGLLAVFVRRLSYPYELEWMEGGVVTHIRVILAGEPLYREPSVAFTPFIYPPLYYYVSALVSKIVGVGLFAPRLVSTLSTVGSMALVARLVRGEGTGWLAPCAAVALFGAGFSLSGFFMDLARVDSLLVLLLLSGVSVLRQGKTKPTAVLAGVLFTLAFFTKQTALLLSGAALAGYFLANRQRAVIAGVTFAVTTGIAVVLFDRATNHWFSYYVLELPRTHGMRWKQSWDFFFDVTWRPMPFALLFAAAGFVGKVVKDRGAWMYAALGVATWAAAYSSLLHEDGFANVLMPWITTLALLAGFGVEAVARTPTLAWRSLGFGAVVVQLLALTVPPARVLPTALDRQAGARMIERLRVEKGPVLILGSGYGPMAGHPEINTHTMGVFDVLKVPNTPPRAKLLEELSAIGASRKYPTIVTDPSFALLPADVMDGIRRNYREGTALFDTPGGTWPRTGYGARPDKVWRLRE